LKTRIAVTAATGRLGTAILRTLASRAGDVDLVAVAREPARIAQAGVEPRAGDYASVPAMTTALRGINTALLVSAPVAGGSDRVSLHRNAIEAARRAGVRRILFTSVVGNGGESATWFGPTQQVNRQAEADLSASGLEWTVGRNGLYLELDLAQIRLAAAADGVYTNPGSDGRAPYISIAELAQAWAAMALDEQLSGRTLNIVGECLTQAEVVRHVRDVFGLEVRYQAIDDEAMLKKFSVLMPGRGEAVARMLTGCFQAIRAGALDVPSDFEEITGRPAKSVRQMLTDLRDSDPAPSATARNA
jgi:NAD(P)H dehydrogenase (quinone)